MLVIFTLGHGCLKRGGTTVHGSIIVARERSERADSQVMTH